MLPQPEEPARAGSVQRTADASRDGQEAKAAAFARRLNAHVTNMKPKAISRTIMKLNAFL
jgi:hypothetical protein